MCMSIRLICMSSCSVRIARSVVALLSFPLLPLGSFVTARIDTFHCIICIIVEMGYFGVCVRVWWDGTCSLAKWATGYHILGGYLILCRISTLTSV
jgi:hypothetical protein